MDWTEYNEQRKAERADNRDKALRDYQVAVQFAKEHNLALRQCSEAHYQLAAFQGAKARWVFNIYPGNRRIWSDPKYKGPYLKLPGAWTLTDVIRAVVQEQERRTPCKSPKTSSPRKSAS